MPVDHHNGVRRSDAERFDALIRPHISRLYRTAYHYTRRREDAEDLVQDLLTKLYSRLDELEAVTDLQPWLTRVLYHAFIDGTRRQARSPQAQEDAEPAELQAAEDPHADVLQLEQRRALNHALAELSPEHRAVVTLHLIEGHSLPELSRSLGLQIGTLKSRLHRAKAQLREALDMTEPFPADERVSNHELQ